MLFRNLLLAIGLFSLVAGVVLSVIWLDQVRRTAVAVKEPNPLQAGIVVAARTIPAGTLLRQTDLAFKDAATGEVSARAPSGGRNEADYVGAITRRPFALHEPLNAAELVKAGDRQFLAAVLRPGTRAVSIAVDASQGGAGLALPGDYVDVILTQSFGENASELPHRSVGETVLRDIRVIAVDQTLNSSKSGLVERAVFSSTETRVPKTVTLEVNEREAEILFVGVQLGRVNLSVRSLERADGEGDRRKAPPVWASDVSPALLQAARKQTSTATGIEKSIRFAPGVTP